MQNYSLLEQFFSAMRSSLDIKFKRRRGTLPPWTTLLLLMQLTIGNRSVGYLGTICKMMTTCGALLGWKQDQDPNASSFCRARTKLSASMLQKVLAAALAEVQPRLDSAMPRVHGRRVLAIDGAKVNIPRTKTLRELFGCPKGGPRGERVHQPQLLVVLLVDVLTRFVVAYEILPHDGSERAGAHALLRHVLPDDILLFDRGFHARTLIADISSLKNVGYIFRMCAGERGWRELRAAQRQRNPDAGVMIALGDELRPARHLSYVHQRGRPRRGTREETMHLLTNLPRQGFGRKLIRELYRARWGIETMIEEFKISLDGENFHARTAAGIRQEIDVLFLCLSLAALADVAAKIAAGIDIDSPLDPHRKICNRMALLEILAGVVALGGAPTACNQGDAAIRSVGRRAQRRRDGRCFERKCRGRYGRWKQFGGKSRRN